MNPFPFTRITLFALAALLVLTACGPKPQVPGKTDSAAVDPTKAAFDIKGEVVGLLPERKTLLVHHEEIPNYMPAMTMEFTIGSADFSVFKESQRITARMTQPEPGTFLLERIRILDAEKDRIAAAAAAELRQETLIRGKSAHREVGENAPRFTLYNQEGQLVPFDKFRGRRVVLNFIFTRCPVATMCPAATAKMAALQRLARDQGIKDVEFISITLDPEYDTPRS
jgi:protein SCO1/2